MTFLRVVLTVALALGSASAQAREIENTLNRSEARALLADLVSFRTVDGNEQGRAIINYLVAHFTNGGFSSSDIELLTSDDRVGMMVRYRGPPDSPKKPALFLAHMDVVDAKAEEWKSDPWSLVERDGALYGRGVVDNKYGLTTLVQAFTRLKREGFMPDRDLILVLSGDEETGMRTTRALAERLKGAAFAINSDAGGGYRGETGEVIYVYQAAEKSYATYELTVRNTGGHSSRPRSDNAIYELARALDRISKISFPVRWNDVTIESFKTLLPTLPSDVKMRLERFIESPGDETGEALLQADASFVGDLKTTCVATMIQGGVIENALPTEATATVNCRIFPGESGAETQALLIGSTGEENIEIEVKNSLGESAVSVMPTEVLRALEVVLASRAPTASISPYMEAGATDGLQFRRLGIPTVGAGPLLSSNDSNYNYHGIDERLPVSEFNDGLDHYYLFIKALSSHTH